MKLPLVLAIALFLNFAIANSQEAPKPQAAQKKNRTEQRGSEKSPIFVRTPGPSTQAERNYETYEKQEKPSNERRITNATVALACITALLALFTAGLWYHTYKLVREAKDTAKRQLRAYVCMAELLIENAKEEIPNRVLCLRMRNLGTTPANNAIIRASITASEPSGDLYDAGKPFDFGLNPQMIYPGKSYQARFIIGVETLKESFLNSAVYVRGHIDYEDIFGSKWRSQFCWEHRSPGQGWVPYKKHNDEKAIGRAQS